MLYIVYTYLLGMLYLIHIHSRSDKPEKFLFTLLTGRTTTALMASNHTYKYTFSTHIDSKYFCPGSGSVSKRGKPLNTEVLHDDRKSYVKPTVPLTQKVQAKSIL